MSTTITLLHAAGALDAAGIASRRGGVLIESDGARCLVLAAGEFDEISAHPAAASARRTDMSRHVLLPALVNAHTHLDLSALGPRPYRPFLGFVGWLSMIRRARRRDTHTPGDAVALGCLMLRRGGVAGVGDIAGAFQTEPVQALRRSGIEGVSFVEAFGMGGRQAAAVEFFESLVNEGGGGVGGVGGVGGGGGGGRIPLQQAGIRLGLQPHAPYSAGLDIYRAAARLRRELGVPIATHLAESMPERRFIRDARGPLRLFLRLLRLWDPSYLEQIGQGKRPVEHLADVLAEAGGFERSGGWVVIHVNDCTPDEIGILASTRAHVVYCPRASAYFRHERTLGPHRYREMLDAGINVALGTDSIVGIPRGQADRLSTLDEMRFLWRRDGTDPARLLAMATINGARALGLDESRFTLAPGPIAGLIAIDVSATPDDMPPAQRILESEAMPEWICPKVAPVSRPVFPGDTDSDGTTEPAP